MCAAGNVSGFLAALGRGGLNFIITIWLQGIWLPLHGYSFEQPPLWAGIYMLPLTFGFLLMGPLCGHLSDKYGARFFSTAGMLVAAAGFGGLMTLPPNFNYLPFGVFILLVGMGMGMFAAPHTTSIMNSVPAEHRGVTSGMRSTFQNSANTLSITMIFCVVTLGLAAKLPSTMLQGLTQMGVPASDAQRVASLPPTSALFAAFLGYHPRATILPDAVLKTLPQATQANLLGKTFYPNLLAGRFESGLHMAFGISIGMMLLAALASFMRGERYIRDEQQDVLPEEVQGLEAAGGKKLE
jgi:MFS family permease